MLPGLQACLGRVRPSVHRLEKGERENSRETQYQKED
jgi:hypothetical protein